ncbi:MAG: RHS repeat protein [Synechococcaceae cyanobacterium SM2_3_1]|nr:RHS repeat protein [Synechococcaceae cyanobacterium SM2_3_1]
MVDGVIGQLDTSVLPNDSYRVRVRATDATGKESRLEDQTSISGELKLGNFQLSFVDLEIPVSGIPITLVRTYDSLNANTTDELGYGWRLEFKDADVRVNLPRDPVFEELGYRSVGFRDETKVFVTLPGGTRETFFFDPTIVIWSLFLPGSQGNLFYPAFRPDKGVTSQLRVKDAVETAIGFSNNDATNAIFLNPDGEYVNVQGQRYNPANPYYGGIYILRTKEGIEYEIDGQTGDINAITDPNGNVLTFTDDGLFSSTGKSITFGRDSQGRITTVTDPMGNVIRYDYDANRDLVAVTDREENTTQFKYEEPSREHYLTEIVDPLGRTGARTEYNPQGQLEQILDVNDSAIQLEYDLDNSIQTIRDVFGNPTTYVYDERGNIVTEIDPVGLRTERTYDSDNNLRTETLITSESGPEGWITTYTYDADRNLLTETDPLGNTTRYTYARLAQVETETNPLGETSRYEYDNRSNLRIFKTPLGHMTIMTYDNQCNLKSVTDAEQAVTEFDYDSVGNLTLVRDTKLHETMYTYDGNGNRITEKTTVTTPDGVQEVLTQRNYDRNNRLRILTNPEEEVSEFRYDPNGLQILAVDALNRETKYRYNDKNQLVETIYPDGTPQTDADNPRQITLFDRDDRQRVEIDELGRVTHYVYDAEDRVIATIYPDETDTLADLVQLLAPGETLATIDWTEVIYPDETPGFLSDNPRTQTEYFPDGPVKADIDERGNRTKYFYDQRRLLMRSENPQLSTEPGVTYSTTYRYNAAGRPTHITDAQGRTTVTFYNDDGLVEKIHYPDNTFSQTVYDKLGRPTREIDQEGNNIDYEYDSLSQLTAVIQYPEQKNQQPTALRTKYQYDELGRLVLIRDANRHETSHEYDLAGRQTATVLPKLQRSDIAYDAVGNAVAITDFNRELMTQAFDERNRLIRKEFADGTFESYTYTPTGQRETVNDLRGLTNYIYDERDRLVSRKDPNTPYTAQGNTIEYTYDSAGNRTSVTTPSSTVTYDFDEWNRMRRVTDHTSQQTVYSYDGVSNLKQTVLPNQVVETREYDLLDRLLTLENKLEDTILSSYRYRLNKIGYRQAVDEHNGRRVEYEYDDLYRLAQEKITDPRDSINNGRVFSYNYDPVGNRKNRIDSLEGTTTYQYDDNDQLLNEATQLNGEIVREVDYSYDANGNTTSRLENDTEESIYSWNQENQLLGSRLPDGTQLFYEYDVDGIRTQLWRNGERTVFTVDTNQPYAQALVEQSEGSEPIAYIYGQDLISQATDQRILIYLVDGLGSVRTMTDYGGNDIASYDYDAYGQLIDFTGIVQNFLFAGEQFDESLNNYYLRQRYYEPRIGRFTQRDYFGGKVTYPLSLHSYIYGNNSPINNIDPSGLISISNVLAGVIISGFFLSPVVSGTATVIRGGDFEDGLIAALGGYINHINCLIRGGYDRDDISLVPLTTAGAVSVSPYVLGSFGVSKKWVQTWPRQIVEILRPRLMLKSGSAGTTNLVRIAAVLSRRFFGPNDLTTRGLEGIAISIKALVKGKNIQIWTGQGLKGAGSLGLQIILTYGAVRTTQCLGSQLAGELYDLY